MANREAQRIGCAGQLRPRGFSLAREFQIEGQIPMVDGDGRRRLRHDSETGDADDAQHGDWTRERLIKMDARFRQRLAQAIERGKERAPSTTIDQR